MIPARPATDKSQTFNGLLDEIRRRRDLPSDYALAKHMGWTYPRLSAWRTRGKGPSDEVCAAVAAELELSALYVIAVAKLDKQPPEQLANAWRSLAKMTKSAALTAGLVIAGAGAQFAPAPASAVGLTTYTLCASRRRDPLAAGASPRLPLQARA